MSTGWNIATRGRTQSLIINLLGNEYWLEHLVCLSTTSSIINLLGNEYWLEQRRYSPRKNSNYKPTGK